jgi:pimeloyl-ACP methyl ester carboxylesterase
VVGRLFRIAAVLSCSALAFVGILRFLEHASLYHPHAYRANYRQLLSTGAIELQFKTSAGRQTAFYIPPHNGSGLPDRIWVAFCGNGSLALDWLPLTARNKAPGNAFLLVDYPGYGKSEGWPNIANTQAAAKGALVALAARLGAEPRTLEPRLDTMGHSLGAAAALDFAKEHPQVRRIILLAAFTSLREEAAIFIGSPLSHLLRADYDNRAVLRQLAQRRPPPRVVIFHGLKDGMIPPGMSRELAAEFAAFVTFRGIPEANHDTVVSAAEDEILGLLADDTGERLAR